MQSDHEPFFKGKKIKERKEWLELRNTHRYDVVLPKKCKTGPTSR